MMMHERKILPEYFEAVRAGAKTVELRKEDREQGFAVGDTLRLREYREQGGYTGREVMVRVTHVLRDDHHRWLQPGVVALSITRMPESSDPMQDMLASQKEDCTIPWGTLGAISFVPIMERPFPYERDAYWQTDHWVGYVYQQDMVMSCPWCGALSRVTFQPPNGWTWNGDYEHPTVSPSLLVLGGHKGCRMHIFIRDGRIVDAGTPWHEPRRVDNDH